MELSKTVYKYPLFGQIGQEHTIMFPGAAKAIHFDLMEDGYFYLWAEVTPAVLPLVSRKFKIVGTGWELPPDAEHIAIILTVENFVWHLYDLGPA